jgi:hypothetical protein
MGVSNDPSLFATEQVHLEFPDPQLLPGAELTPPRILFIPEWANKIFAHASGMLFISRML